MLATASVTSTQADAAAESARPDFSECAVFMSCPFLKVGPDPRTPNTSRVWRVFARLESVTGARPLVDSCTFPVAEARSRCARAPVCAGSPTDAAVLSSGGLFDGYENAQ